MTTPDEKAKQLLSDKRANAVKLLENFSWEDLDAFYAQRITGLLRDFCAVNPSDHGALAQAQGQLREALNYTDLRDVLKRTISNVDQALKNTA